ncbi:MAG: DUF2855 family protein [Pseudomonadota bacterium]
MTTSIHTFEVDRDTHSVGRIDVAADAACSDGAAVLAIESLALTANNVTYALFGDAIGYWRFFPASDATSGRVPAWGFATVVDSTHAEITAGSRWYGFFPIATHLVVEPGKVSHDGFLAADSHRRELPAAYNVYRAATPANGFVPDHDVVNMVFRPLFLTGYLIAETLDAQVPDATAIVSSASSKTAIATAADIRRRGNRRCIGLTSVGNVAFVEGLGLYDRVVTYDRIDDIAIETAAFVDIAGNAAMRDAVHTRLDAQLLASLAVGAAHGAMPATRPSAGPAPHLFFAPAVYDQRIKELGRDAFERAFAGAWAAFVAQATDWLTPATAKGIDAVPALWQRLVAGDVAANEALIIRP